MDKATKILGALLAAAYRDVFGINRTRLKGRKRRKPYNYYAYRQAEREYRHEVAAENMFKKIEEDDYWDQMAERYTREDGTIG